MSTYDEQYYFLRPADDDRLPDLTPDANTEDRKFRYEAQALGSPPLVFYNGGKDYQQKMRIPSAEVLPDVLFEGSNLVVRDPIRRALLAYDVSNMHLHPTVYIHDDGVWHEDYWYVTFTERLDCWDRNTSDYERDDPPIRLGGFELFQIYSYSLSSSILDQIPQDQRLIFKMGGTLDGFVACHWKLAHLFSGANSGVELMKISDY